MDPINLYDVTIKGIPKTKSSLPSRNKVTILEAKRIVGRDGDDEGLLKKAMRQLKVANNAHNQWVFQKKVFVKKVSD